MLNPPDTQVKPKSSASDKIKTVINMAQFGMDTMQHAKTAWNGLHGHNIQPNTEINPTKVFNDSQGMVSTTKEILTQVASGSNPMSAAKKFAEQAGNVTSGVSGVLGPIGAVVSAGSAVNTVIKTYEISNHCKPEHLLKGLKILDEKINKQGGMAQAEPELVEKRNNLINNTVALARANIADEISPDKSLSQAEKSAKIDGLVTSFSKHAVFPAADHDQIKQIITKPPTQEERAAVTVLKQNVSSAQNHGVVYSIAQTLSAVGTSLIAASPLFPPLAVAGAVSAGLGTVIDLGHTALAKPQKIEDLVTKRLMACETVVSTAEANNTANQAPSWCKPSKVPEMEKSQGIQVS